jgi:hypothetical protein
VASCGTVCRGQIPGGNVTALDSAGSKRQGAPFSGGGIRSPSAIAIDSGNNVWVAYQASPFSSVTELSSVNYTPLSPPTGFSSDGSGGLTQPVGIAIDPSGNLWMPAGYGIYEIVGAAAPVKTPTMGPPQLP